MTNHYETLGVSKTATPDEIKKAYRKLASKHHPDKGGDTATFQKIEEAYRTLSDPDQRQQYDNPQSQSFRFNTSDFDGMPPEFGDIFRNFGFGGQSPFGQRPTSRRNKDLRVDVAVQLPETLNEHKKILSVQTTTGHRETVEVTVPRGVTNGTTVKYSGLGDNLFNTLQRGDLYIHFHVLPHQTFRASDINLISKKEITCFDAILGTDLEITGLDNRVFVLSVPPGTQPGTMLRIKGEGLYAMNQNIRGNLLIELSITVPRHLSEDQLNLVRQIQSNQ
jgi:curved DNA-binding protein